MTHRNPNIRLEEDNVPAVFLSVIIVVVVLVIIGGVAWTRIIYVRETEKLGGFPTTIPVQATRSIGGVNQTLIHVDREGQRVEARQRLMLEQRGWVDRDRGIVRIPIDDAIRITAEGAGR